MRTLLWFAMLPLVVEAQTSLDAKACKALPLTHAEEDQRDRAGRSLYFKCDRSILKDASVAAKLLEHVRKGTTSAGSVVLLGYVESGKTELARLLSSSQSMKLTPSTGVVPASVPASVALAQSGSSAQLERLSKDKSLVKREFLLDVARDIPDKDLRVLTPFLDDTREIDSGVPSHATPKRRLCDAALFTLIHRLNLKVSFELNDARRYTDEERAEARKAIAGALGV